jgi:hypothetical protein
MALRIVTASRYVVPFREGGSVPALFEGDDSGLWVTKLRGAAQGVKPLVAELVCGELARAFGLAVPEIVFVDVDRAFGAAERDPEIAEPLEKSAGRNLGLDYLPGSVTYDPAARPPIDAATAARIVLFDAFVANVDRTAKNPNLLRWHDRVWLIDHGAALWFHHGWGPQDPLLGANDPFAEVRSHVLLGRAGALAPAAAALGDLLTRDVIGPIVALVPDDWLGGSFADPAAERAAYGAWFAARVRALPAILEEAERAQRV